MLPENFGDASTVKWCLGGFFAFDEAGILGSEAGLAGKTPFERGDNTLIVSGLPNGVLIDAGDSAGVA